MKSEVELLDSFSDPAITNLQADLETLALLKSMTMKRIQFSQLQWDAEAAKETADTNALTRLNREFVALSRQIFTITKTEDSIRKEIRLLTVGQSPMEAAEQIRKRHNIAQMNAKLETIDWLNTEPLESQEATALPEEKPWVEPYAADWMYKVSDALLLERVNKIHAGVAPDFPYSRFNITDALNKRGLHTEPLPENTFVREMMNKQGVKIKTR